MYFYTGILYKLSFMKWILEYRTGGRNAEGVTAELIIFRRRGDESKVCTVRLSAGTRLFFFTTTSSSSSSSSSSRVRRLRRPITLFATLRGHRGEQGERDSYQMSYLLPTWTRRMSYTAELELSFLNCALVVAIRTSSCPLTFWIVLPYNWLLRAFQKLISNLVRAKPRLMELNWIYSCKIAAWSALSTLWIFFKISPCWRWNFRFSSKHI